MPSAHHKKTICFFNSAKTWGGGEKWHYETALLLQQNGFDVLFIASPGSALHAKLTSTIRCITLGVGNLSFLNPFKIIRLKNILQKNDVQSIIINLPSDLKLAGLSSKLAKIKRIIYRRGSAIPVKNRILNRFYFGYILTDVLANSEATKGTILQNNQQLFPAAKIKVIYNLVNMQEFTQRKYKTVYTKKDNELVLGNIGRLVPQKNQRFLIDVAAVLKSKNVPFKLLIAGEGSLKTELEDYAKEEGVLNEIFFTGFMENVKDLLMSCDVFLLPSLWEGFGYVLAEAAMCKKPIIAFDVSSNPELMINNETGFLSPVNDVEAFLNKIFILQEHPQRAIEFGNNGFQFIKEKFAADKIEIQLLDYLSL